MTRDAAFADAQKYANGIAREVFVYQRGEKYRASIVPKRGWRLAGTVKPLAAPQPVDDYSDDLENDPEVDELIAPEKTFYVDVPPADLTLNGDDGTTWINVDSFQTREEAVAFAKEHYGADDVGRVALVTGIPEEDYPENRLNPTKGKEHPISSKTVSDARAVYLAKWLVLAGVGFVAAPDNQGNWTFSVDRNDDDVFARSEV